MALNSNISNHFKKEKEINLKKPWLIEQQQNKNIETNSFRMKVGLQYELDVNTCILIALLFKCL